LAELQLREEEGERRLLQVQQLRECWDARRRRQVVQLRARRTACEELRRQCLAVREEWSKQRGVYLQQQRALAERALALEQFRQQTLTRSSNAAATEKRLEQLRRRWASVSVAQEKHLAQKSRQLAKQAAQLEQRLQREQELENQRLAQEADLSNRQMIWEQQQAAAEAEQAKLRRELQSLHHQRALFERQVQELRDEVERLARLLLDESEQPRLPVGQAA
jgi:hypothetical protein